MTTYFSTKELLFPPTERAAFSDRQGYVCAELTKLAYFKFEGGHTLNQVLEIAKEIFEGDERIALLEQQLSVALTDAPSTSDQARTALQAILKGADFELAETFSKKGTQAFICTKRVVQNATTKKTVAYLVFRGTEPKDFRDIKTDVRAALEKVEVGGDTFELHCGYLAAFREVEVEIKDVLALIQYDQLFITGHSLGGALAMVATRLLASDTTGACYTFGAPPIGTVAVQNQLKTPIYEIINEVDIVPRLPNPWAASVVLFFLRLLRLLLKSITIIEKLLASGTWDERMEKYVQAMTKYRHPGYVSYLVGQGSAARLRYNVSSFDRFRWWFAMMWKRRIFRFKKMITDHNIDEYVSKMRAHALRRQ